MTQEVEIKVLNIPVQKVKDKLESLNAKFVNETFLKVWWYCNPEDIKGPWPWFLRIRSYSDEKFEVTWKAHSKISTHSRSHTEINFTVDSLEQCKAFFTEMNLVEYAYQEKQRFSWKLKDWKFDLDIYPGIPAYLEIEGKNDARIQEAIYLLQLQEYELSTEGERILISQIYKKDWFSMKF